MKDLLMREFRVASKSGVKIVDMSASELAGYYLQVYPGNPIGALVIDMTNLAVPSTVALAAKVIIKSVGGI